MKTSQIITPQYLEQIAKSVKESEAYKRKFETAKESYAKNKEALIKAGIVKG